MRDYASGSPRLILVFVPAEGATAVMSLGSLELSFGRELALSDGPRRFEAWIFYFTVGVYSIGPKNVPFGLIGVAASVSISHF